MAITVTKDIDVRSTLITISPSGVVTTDWQIFSSGQSVGSKSTFTNPYPIGFSSGDTKPGNISVLSTSQVSIWLPPNQTFQIRYRLDGGTWTSLESFTSIGYFNSYARYLSLI